MEEGAHACRVIHTSLLASKVSLSSNHGEELLSPLEYRVGETTLERPGKPCSRISRQNPPGQAVLLPVRLVAPELQKRACVEKHPEAASQVAGRVAGVQGGQTGCGLVVGVHALR